MGNFTVQEQPHPLAEDFLGSSGNSFLVSCDFLILIFFVVLSLWTQLWKWNERAAAQTHGMCCVMQHEQPAVELLWKLLNSWEHKKKPGSVWNLLCYTLTLLLLLAFMVWFHPGAVVSLIHRESMVA